MGLALNIAHVNVHVTDLDRSVAFYALLGWQPIAGTEWLDAPQQIDALDCGPSLEHGGGVTRAAILACSDDPRATTALELMEYVEPAATAKPFKPRYEAGPHRIAMRVRDLDHAVAELRAAGVEIAHEPQETELLGGTQRYVVFADPDNNPIELVQLTVPRQENS